MQKASLLGSLTARGKCFLERERGGGLGGMHARYGSMRLRKVGPQWRSDDSIKKYDPCRRAQQAQRKKIKQHHHKPKKTGGRVVGAQAN